MLYGVDSQGCGCGGGSGLTPFEEEALVENMLRERVGIDPHRLGEVLDLFAVGIVNGAWRNGPVEDWHAGGGLLSDGAMLRVNAHTTWRVREIGRRWRDGFGLTSDSPSSMLDELDWEQDVGLLLVRIVRWLAKPMRPLPIGITLGELAGDRFEEYEQHVRLAVGSVDVTAERRGGRFAVWRAAAHGGLACRHWWGTPGWPPLVDRFMKVLDDPEHDHWGEGGEWRAELGPEPAHMVERTKLRRKLLSRPWDLDPETAEWVVSAGIGYLREG